MSLSDEYLYEGLTLEQWRTRADLALTKQWSYAKTSHAYYEGDHPLPFVPREHRHAFRHLLKQCRSNWCELIVDAVAERMTVVGFRFGDEAADHTAWTLWQANDLDADAELAITDALSDGLSYMLVQPDESSPVGVTITGEHASECVVLYRPGRRRERMAGYKRFYDVGTSSGTAVLQLPDVIATWDLVAGGTNWGRPDIATNPLGEVSMVAIRPQPRTVGPPRSELMGTGVISIQDRINTTIYNRLVATDFAAFRQIWATGLPLRKAPDGKADTQKPPFDVGADRLLVSEDPNTKFGVIDESTLSGYIRAVEEDVQHLAAITRTPPHYLLGRMVNVSGDALKAAETGLVAKVKRRAGHVGEDLEEVMRLALSVVGTPESVNVISAETVWADFESRSEGQTVDALVKMRTLGVPLEVLWQRWGASPQQVTEWKAMAQEEKSWAPPLPLIPGQPALPAPPMPGGSA